MAVNGHRCTSEWHFGSNAKRQTVSHSFLLDGDSSPNHAAHNVYDPITNDPKADKQLPGLYISNLELKRKQSQKRDRSFHDYVAGEGEKAQANYLSTPIANRETTGTDDLYGLQESQTNLLFKLHPSGDGDNPSMKAVNVTDILSKTTSKFTQPLHLNHDACNQTNPSTW